MPSITSFLNVFILSFLLFSMPTVSRLSDFKKILKKKPPYIFTLKARNIERERQRETETEKETERRRDI